MDRVSRGQAAGVALGAAAILLLGPSPPLFNDTTTDFLLARDCLDGAQCGGHSASVMGLEQGRGWILVLTGLLSLGGGVAAVHALVTVLHTLAIALGWWVATHHAGARTGYVSAVLLLGLTLQASGYPILWNPSLVPLVGVVFVAASVEAVGRRSWRWALGAAVALGLAAECHIAALALTPSLAAVAGVALSGYLVPWVVAMVPVAVHAAISPTTIAVNLGVLGATGFVAATVAVVAGLGFGHWVRLKRAQWLDEGGLPLTLGILVVPMGALVTVGGAMGMPVALRYVSPVVLALAVLGALLFESGRNTTSRWRRFGARALLVATTVVLCGPHVIEGLTYDATRSARHPRHRMAAAMELVQRAGRRYDLADVVGRLQTPGRVPVLEVAGLVYGRTMARPRFQGSLLRAMALPDGLSSDGAPPQGWSCGEDECRTLWSDGLESWLRWSEFEVCDGPGIREGACTVIDQAAWAGVTGGPERVFSQLSDVTLAPMREFSQRVAQSGPDARIYVRVPIEATAEGVRWVVLVHHRETAPAWRFEGAEGLRVHLVTAAADEAGTGEPDAAQVVSTTAGARGVLVMSAPMEYQGRERMPEYPPSVMEFTPDERVLMDQLRVLTPLEQWWGRRLFE